MTINPSNGSNFGAPFTIFVVANIKSFTGRKWLFGSNIVNGPELLFYDENQTMYAYFSQAGAPGKIINLNPGGSPNPTQMDGNGINIFTITCSADSSFKFYLNSKLIGSDKLNGPIINAPITLGASVFGQVYSSEDTNIDYYNFMHFTGVLPDDWRPIYELYFGCKYGIKPKLEGNNMYYKHNFTDFPF